MTRMLRPVPLRITWILYLHLFKGSPRLQLLMASVPLPLSIIRPVSSTYIRTKLEAWLRFPLGPLFTTIRKRWQLQPQLSLHTLQSDIHTPYQWYLVLRLERLLKTRIIHPTNFCFIIMTNNMIIIIIKTRLIYFNLLQMPLRLSRIVRSSKRTPFRWMMSSLDLWTVHACDAHNFTLPSHQISQVHGECHSDDANLTKTFSTPYHVRATKPLE